ncbi:MAG: TIGR04348 family glycosyltransferase [Burkholderiales bacterium]|nr:TIGR04348 family glycosyltransferase [Burkholderiales bacterium]
MARPRIAIVTPALAAANNGNWQTAWRWSRMLSAAYRTQILPRWSGEAADLMIALHARRSAESIAAWSAARPSRPLVVVLTGTDLYRDIAVDAAAQRSLALADRLVVLQEQGPRMLAPALRGKTRVVFQSTAARRTLAKTRRHLRALMVGHLRPEKSPETWHKAARILAERDDILLDHIGAPLDEELAAAARATAADCPNYRWLGALDHAQTLKRIQRAHLLVHASRMEGGAHVVLEAVRAGTPVLASRIDGNVGMLGADYAGYFRWGNAAQLAAMLVQCRQGQARADGGLLARMAAQCAARAPLFAPAREAAELRALAAELLGA